MQLKYDIPASKALPLEEGESLYYCVPYDVSQEDRSWITDGYLAVSSKRVFVLRGSEVVKTYTISQMKHTRAEVTIGGGMLVTTIDGVQNFIVRYSAKHRTRFAYMARGINILSKGRTEMVESHEHETQCPVCGRALTQSGICPKCADQGGLFRDFVKLVVPYRKRIVVITLVMILASVVTLLNPHLQGKLIDDVFKSEDGSMQKAMLFLGGMFFLGAGIVVINVIKTYLCTLLGTQIAKDVRKTLFDKLQRLSVQFVNDRRPGELMERVVYDTDNIKYFMQNTFCNLFTVVIIFALDVIFMVLMNWKMALLAFTSAPFGVWFTLQFRKTIRRRYHMQYRREDEVSSNLQDVISGMRVVKTYGKEAKEKQKFDDLAEQFSKISFSNERFWALFNPLIHFIMGFGIFFVLMYGGMKVLDEEMSSGDLFKFVTYTNMLYQYIQWMTSMPREITGLISSMERINDVMMQEELIRDDDDAIRHDIEGEVEFRHASFGYKSYEPVLEDINLKVKKGEMIGIVGPSGAGKSTLINLLMRLYEIDDGELFIDGIPLKDIRNDYYHSQLGVVLQETFLFTGTILSNIRFAKPDASYEEVIQAAKLANAHDFITKMPDGYNTYVGEKGMTLSGGERQRIAIARAILKQPRLLILDEATASLDTESEFLIQQALERLTEGRTTFAIAHRLSTLKNADRLLVIDDHTIAEIGTHEELVAQKGIYYRLVKAQLEMQAQAGA